MSQTTPTRILKSDPLLWTDLDHPFREKKDSLKEADKLARQLIMHRVISMANQTNEFSLDYISVLYQLIMKPENTLMDAGFLQHLFIGTIAVIWEEEGRGQH